MDVWRQSDLVAGSSSTARPSPGHVHRSRARDRPGRRVDRRAVAGRPSTATPACTSARRGARRSTASCTVRRRGRRPGTRSTARRGTELSFALPGSRLGMSICYDLRFADRSPSGRARSERFTLATTRDHWEVCCGPGDRESVLRGRPNQIGASGRFRGALADRRSVGGRAGRRHDARPRSWPTSISSATRSALPAWPSRPDAYG